MPLFTWTSKLRLAGIVCLLGLPSTATGQPSDASESGRKLEEVVVTAQRREESLQDVPASVSVVSGAELTQSQTRDMQDLAERIPTVKIANTAGGVSLINIRGFGSGDNVGFEQAVSTFVDSAYRPRAISQHLAFFDLERVEVLKGPQTTFFGTNATAGAFNITTRKPDPGQPVQADFTGLYEPDFGEYDVQGGVSASLNDRLGVRVAGKLYGMDGYGHNSFTDKDEPRPDDFAVRGSFAWEPADFYRMDFRVDRAESDVGGYWTSEIQHCPPPERLGLPAAGYCALYLAQEGGSVEDEVDNDTALPDTFFDFEFTEYVLNNEWTLGRHTLTATTAYYTHDNAHTLTPMPFPVPGTTGEAPPLPAYFSEEFDQFTQEIRFESNIGERVDYMLGVYYREGELDSLANVGLHFIPPIPPGAGYQVGIDQESTTGSAFGAVDIRISQALRVSMGLRYSAVEKTADRHIAIGTMAAEPLPETFMPLPQAAQDALAPALAIDLSEFANQDRSDEGFMPSVSVEYDLTRDLMAYGSFSKGFKAGGFGVSTSPRTFAEETVRSFEAGLKAELLGGSMRAQLAAYTATYDDLQQSLNRENESGNIETIVTNVGRAESRGVDLSVTWQATNALSVYTDIGYLDSIYERYVGAPCNDIAAALSNCGNPADNTTDLSGKTRQFSPDWSGTVGANYSVPMRGGQLTVNPTVNFSSEFFTLPTRHPLSIQDAYYKLNLRVAYGARDGRWEVALLGKNLNDEITSSFRNGTPTAPGTMYVQADRPRSIALQFSMNYGGR